MAPEELTRHVAEALAPLESVRAAWVFGSRITQTATPRSDLDVAVVFRRDVDDVERERMRRESSRR